MSKRNVLDIEAILKRCEDATAGPWYVVGPPWRASWFDKSIRMHRSVPTYIVAGCEDPHVGKPVCEAPDIEEWPADDADLPYQETYDGMVEQSDADLEFIAHARTDVPLLVQEIERLRASDKYHRDTIAKCNSHICEQEQEIERLRAELSARDEQLNRCLDSARQERDGWRADIERLQRAVYGGEGVWIWQGDGTDHPESLSCQVLMTAYQLRELIDSISRLQAEIERLRECWTTLEQLRAEGWCVVVKALPDGRPFIIEGARSEYDAPCDDQRIAHGKWCCEVQWMRWGDSSEDRYRPGTAMFCDSPEEAVAAAAKILHDRESQP